MKPVENIPFSVIQCDGCKTENKLYLQDYAQTYSCKSCHTLYTRRLPGVWQKKVKFTAAAKTKFYLPLHSIATIEGYTYIVTTCIHTMDADGYYFREYWLYNSKRGYIYLSEYAGHWIKLVDFDENISVAGQTTGMKLYHDGTDYDKFAMYNYRHVCIEGELPGPPVLKFGSARVSEYISPPYLIAFEKTNDSVYHYMGEHIEIDEIDDWFKISGRERPVKRGVGMVQPAKIRMDELHAIALSVMAFLIILLTTLILNARCSNKVVYSEYMSGIGDSSVFVSPEIVLDDGTRNLMFSLYADVDNNWAGANIDLINIETGDIISVYNEVEYYHGVTDGESWSEGGQTNYCILSSVPSGKYRIEVTPERSMLIKPSTMSLEVKRDVPIYRNLLFAMAFLAIVPIALRLLNRNFEVSRWSNSAYSPYESE